VVENDVTTLGDVFIQLHGPGGSSGESIVEHVAGVEDYQVALATYRAACERWPGTPITLRQGARVIEDSRPSGHRPDRNPAVQEVRVNVCYHFGLRQARCRALRPLKSSVRVFAETHTGTREEPVSDTLLTHTLIGSSEPRL